MRTTFFSGAGVSRAFGFPLTSDLLPRALDGLHNDSLFTATEDQATTDPDREALKKYLGALIPGSAGAERKDLPLITDLFSLVEHAIASEEALPVGGDERTRHCRQLLKWAITDVLLAESLTDYDHNDPLKRTLDGTEAWYRNQEEIAMVTTNYDFVLENRLYKSHSLRSIQEKLDLGTDWRDVVHNKQHTRPTEPDLRVYKLHGSLDTLRCRVCGHIYFNHEGDIAWQAFRKVVDKDNTCICSTDIKLDLHIVAPSLVRDMKDGNLLSVWRTAFEWMRTSDRWILAGDSLPPEDLAVRSLLLRAYFAAPKEKKPKVIIVQHGEDALPRYRMLFPECDYIAGGMDEFLAQGI